ncbi:MAG: hypothetical protein ABI665_10190 [Vicinamibacterales bacterium]
MGKNIYLAVIVALLAGNATPAFAQGEFVKENLSRLIKKVGVHVGIGLSEPLDSDVTKATKYGVSVGLAPGRGNGWKYPVGITWFSEELRGASGEQFGLLQTRAALAGVGYGWHFGKLSTTVALQAGIALNTVKLDAAAARVFDSESEPKIRLKNSAIVRPQVRFEYFITERITVRTALSYIHTQPNIAVQTSAGPAPGNWNAHNVNAAIGLGYYPFRKQ